MFILDLDFQKGQRQDVYMTILVQIVVLLYTRLQSLHTLQRLENT